MKKSKIVIFIITILIIIIAINIKINTKRDFIWHLKENLHPKIIFGLKKLYLFYSHDIRKKITLKRITVNQDFYQQEVKSKTEKYKITKFRNKLFKKNGPKVFIETFDNTLISITGTGILSYTNLNDFKNDTVNLKIIRNNLKNIFGLDKIAKNPGIVLNMLVHKNKIFISYVNEKEKNCFNTSVLMGDIDLKKISFRQIFNPDKCIKKNNDYGEFYILEAGGALEMFNDNQLLLSTGTFRFSDLAQKKDNIFGKILLINLNDKKQKIISMGHRNVQGIFYHKNKDIIFSTDHGPQGGDEINIIFEPLNNKIKNFGWPISSYGEHYGGRIEKNKKKYKKAPLYKSHLKYGFIEPHAYFVPSIAPSNIIFIPSKFNKKNSDQIFISSLGFNNDKGRRSIHSFSFNQNQKLDSHEIIPLDDRVRDILYVDNLNSIFLFLERSASITILSLIE